MMGLRRLMTSLRRKPRFPRNIVTKNDKVVPELEHSMSLEMDEILERLPRVGKGPLNARIWLDASGRLCILPEGGGFLGVPDEVLYTIIEADAKDDIADWDD